MTQKNRDRGEMEKISAGKFHFEPPFTSFDHLVAGSVVCEDADNLARNYGQYNRETIDRRKKQCGDKDQCKAHCDRAN
jgi:hypothetical protein